MDPIDTPEWADNPRLSGWLAEQRRAFPAWAAEHGGDWDFAPASLDRLEDLIRSRFDTWEEVRDARGTPLLEVAAWYLGETLVRRCGVMWRCMPVLPQPHPPAGGYPLVTYARDGLTEYEQEVLEDLEERLEMSVPLLDPADAIRSLFAVPGYRLGGTVDRFDRFQEWRRSLPGDVG
ncbi:hypothetical protein ABT247_26905 [Kitasatospora sp. NPDC001539]|uniref:hypothetical protein n=1 Tax=Kitasatospora sp. NPDC001539 TaxID=3154384 RepID=UPI003320C0F2